jgi:hypothetical protein
MTPLLLALCLTQAAPSNDPGPFVRALWLVQRVGINDAANPVNDIRTKAKLAKGLGKDSIFTQTELDGLMDPKTFKSIAGQDDTINASDVSQALDRLAIESRSHLNAKTKSHADALSLSFDMIDPIHREAGQTLADWIFANYRPGQKLDIVVVCTGNSRRSILGSTMGNVAAAYYGFPEIRFHSGGTAPTAFNKRTIESLKAIGIEISPTGEEAPRGEPQTANPKQKVLWGTSGLESVEFSKHYADESNPHANFAALMVCSEADAGCPVVKGAKLRVSMPYLDPKLYDDTPFEAAKYAERRDDIGRLMLSVFSQTRNRLENAR